MKISERNAYVNFVNQKCEVHADVGQKLLSIVNDYQNISARERASRANKLIAPLEKAINELKAYSPSLSLQTPEEQEVALAYKEALTNSMMYQLEEVKMFSLDRELTLEELMNLKMYSDKTLEYWNEAVKQGEAFDLLRKDS